MKNEPTSDTQLFTKIAELIETARQKVATTVNLAMVYTYFEIGRMIIEDEQQGKTRADYGKHILKDLSKRLTEKFGKGFSIENLDKMRFFYKTYAPSISSTPSTKLIQSEKETFYETASRKFILSWSHYLILMRINNSDERSFYEIECAARHWSLKQLKRNYHSSLYERLALSRDKDEIMKLATHGQIIEQPTDILKNPLTLEFLGLEEKAAYSESDLEHAIISYEKPTIGILLCKKKNDAIVELTLPEDANIYATEYSLYLPDKQLLQQKLAEWLIEFDNLKAIGEAEV